MPFKGLAKITGRAAHWPIQTIVLVSLVASSLYISMLDLSVNSYMSALSRTYLVSSPEQWAPTTAARAVAGSDAGDVPRYVAAQLQFSLDGANTTAAEYVLGLLPAGQRDVPRDGTVLLPEADYMAWQAQVRFFSVQGADGAEAWRLRASFSWVVWAKWCFHHLVDLVQATAEFDLGVVGLAYVAMYYVFYSVWRKMRHLGSRMFVFFAALVSPTFALMIAYVVVSRLGVSVPMRTLLQGIPFFVVVVGFDSKVIMFRECVKLLRARPELDVAQIEQEVITTKSRVIFRDNAFELGLLVVAAVSKLPGIWEFCALSALILAVDMLLSVSFYAATLSLKLTMMKVERTDALRRALEEDGVSEAAAEQYADTASGTQQQALQAAPRSPLMPLLKAAVVVVPVVLNSLQLWSFPISLGVSSTGLREPDVKALVHEMATPALLTVMPALKFVPVGREGVVHRVLVFLLRDPSVLRGLIVGLGASLTLNGYLLGLIRKQAGTVKVVEKRVPIMVERRTKADGASVNGSVSGANGVVSRDSSRGSALGGETVRSLDDCVAIMKGGLTAELSNQELTELGVAGKLPLYALEKQLGDATRAVVVRRAIVSRLSSTKTLEKSLLPWQGYDYDRVLGACCENVIGFMPLPIGVAGPIIIDGKESYLPLATTEGVLVASTMRGCKAINAGGGVTTEILQDGMTRGPCVTFSTMSQTASAKRWLDTDEGQRTMKKAFESTSRFAKLHSVKTAMTGSLLFIRFRAQTGDAMGMNMISKGVERALQYMAEEAGYDDMTIVSISGNYCTDKKAAAINWIDGRGKSVVAEAIVPGSVVRSVLKTGVDELVELNTAKNLVGSAMAGALGGFNAHAANLVAAMFIATGQDPAQVVEGSNCMTLMANVDGDLQISVTMPSLEVGTIGGGTILEPQAAVLDMLGVKGPHADTPGENARNLARIIASGVLAGELSLCSALAAGHLVKSHMAHNRKAPSN